MGAFQANAQSVTLTVDDVDVPEKGQAKIVVNYNTGGKILKGYGFTMKLPTGLSFVIDEATGGPKAELVNGKGFVLTYLDGNFGFLPSGPTSSVSAESGTLLKLTIQADETLKNGESFKVDVTDIIVTDDKLAEIAVPQTSFTINIVEDRVIFNEEDTELPLYTAGEKKNVKMTRKIKANSWSTIVLPFTLTKTKAEDAFGTDVKLAEFTGFDTEYSSEEDITPDAITIKFTTYTMSAKKGMTGGKPFLIKTSADVESFEAEEVQLVDAVADVTMADEYETSGKFTGSFVKTVVPADGLFINSEKFYYSTGKTNIKAFRGWFDLKAVLDKETDFGAKIGFTIDGDATDIDGIPSFQRVTEGVYDLSGRKIQLENGDLNKLQKGVYIIDGKKVTIK